MPGEKTQEEHYLSYTASQRRVEEWVHETGQQTQELQAGSSKGFLEDPCLATPISMASPTNFEGPSVLYEKRMHDLHDDHNHAQPNDNDAHQPPHRQSSHHRKRSLDQRRQQREHDIDPTQPASSSSRSRPSKSKKIKVTQASSEKDRLVAPHPKSSKDSRHTIRTAVTGTTGTSTSKSKSRSKTQPSSGSSSRRHRRQRSHTPELRNDWAPGVVAYLPYGIVPLLFAMTTGSSVGSLAAAAVMLAGYLYVDQPAQESSSKR